MSRANPDRNHVDYVVLAQLDSRELLSECIRLRDANPKWDWRRVPATRNQDALNAHQKILAYLNEHNFFQSASPSAAAAAAASSPPPIQFIERWRRRRAAVPVTSDHVLVTNQFRLLSPSAEVLTLRVSTWNLMNKAHSKANCRIKDANGNGLYANTPEEDLDENDQDYRQRKGVQITQIIEHLKSTPDALFLQEIDFLTLPLFSHLRAHFENELNKLGYKLLITESTPACKPQAIIYNNKTLAIDSANPPKTLMPGTHVHGKDSRNTLFEANFTHVRTGQKICLASAHLDFEGNYSGALVKYSEERAATGAMVIWGGDTNHAPGHFIRGLTGDFNHATNYDVAQAQAGYTTQHAGAEKAKAYDGFGFCPPPEYAIQSIEENGLRFHSDPTTGILSIESFTPSHSKHISLVGHPWVRRQEIVLDIFEYKPAIEQVLSKIINNSAEAESIRSQDTIEKIGDIVAQLKVKYPRLDFSEPEALVEQAKGMLEPCNESFMQDCWYILPHAVQARRILTAYFEPTIEFKRNSSGFIEEMIYLKETRNGAVRETVSIFSQRHSAGPSTAPSLEVDARWIKYFDNTSRGFPGEIPAVAPSKKLGDIMRACGYHWEPPAPAAASRA